MKNGWQTKTLDEISINLDSRRVPITKAVRKSGEYPYYGASGIVDFVADYIFDEDTLLISEDGANLLARSTPIAFPASGKYWVNNHAHILKFENMTIQRFVELYLESIPLDDYITGAAQPKLNQKALNSIPIPVPPPTEQQRIVGILDEAFEGTAKARANAEKNLQNARAIFDSHLQSVFSQRGPGWKQKTLEEIATTFGRGKSKHRPRNAPHLYGGKYPFIQTGDIRNADHTITEYSQTYSEAGLAQSKLWPKGTICITIAANIAETGILDFDACFPDSVIGVVTNPKEAEVGFVEPAESISKRSILPFEKATVRTPSPCPAAQTESPSAAVTRSAVPAMAATLGLFSPTSFQPSTVPAGPAIQAPLTARSPSPQICKKILMAISTEP